MTDSPHWHRQSIRLRGYDYAGAGAYFVTVCTAARECILGDIIGDSMHGSAYGMIAREEWSRSEQIRDEIELDAFVVMPNHVHGIVIIREPLARVDDAVRATGRSPRPPGPAPASLAAFVAGWKSAATKRINALRATPGTPVWQRNYYEHIIRDELELRRIQAYIEDNPRRWAEDDENPDTWPRARRRQ